MNTRCEEAKQLADEGWTLKFFRKGLDYVIVGIKIRNGERIVGRETSHLGFATCIHKLYIRKCKRKR